jgi:hypothetical protein
MVSALGSTICSALGGWFFAPPQSQLLYLSWPLLSVSSSSGGLACHATPTLSLHCFSHIHSLRVWHWKFSFLPHPCSPGQFQHSTPTSAVGAILQFTVYAFQFCWCGKFICLGAALDYVPGVWIGDLNMVHYAHLFILQIHTSSFGSDLWGEMAWCREAFHGLEDQDVAEFNSDWCSVFQV